LEVIVLAAAVLLVLLPVLPSVATLPARAYVAWPLLAAWLASRLGPLFGRWPARWLACALAAFLLFAGAIGAALFYSDRIVHQADAALASQLGVAIEQAAGTERPIRVSLAGMRAFPSGGQVRRVEVFGDSFFEHDGGNIHRVVFFLRLQGFGGYEGIWLGNRPDLVAAQAAMPAWPQPGSVRKVGDVVVVKLGEPTPQQLVTH
jgi:hypothetical protein